MANDDLLNPNFDDELDGWTFSYTNSLPEGVFLDSKPSMHFPGWLDAEPDPLIIPPYDIPTFDVSSTAFVGVYTRNSSTSLSSLSITGTHLSDPFLVESYKDGMPVKIEASFQYYFVGKYTTDDPAEYVTNIPNSFALRYNTRVSIKVFLYSDEDATDKIAEWENIASLGGGLEFDESDVTHVGDVVTIQRAIPTDAVTARIELKVELPGLTWDEAHGLDSRPLNQFMAWQHGVAWDEVSIDTDIDLTDGYLLNLKTQQNAFTALSKNRELDNLTRYAPLAFAGTTSGFEYSMDPDLVPFYLKGEPNDEGQYKYRSDFYGEAKLYINTNRGAVQVLTMTQDPPGKYYALKSAFSLTEYFKSDAWARPAQGGLLGSWVGPYSARRGEYIASAPNNFDFIIGSFDHTSNSGQLHYWQDILGFPSVPSPSTFQTWLNTTGFEDSAFPYSNTTSFGFSGFTTDSGSAIHVSADYSAERLYYLFDLYSFQNKQIKEAWVTIPTTGESFVVSLASNGTGVGNIKSIDNRTKVMIPIVWGISRWADIFKRTISDKTTEASPHYDHEIELGNDDHYNNAGVMGASQYAPIPLNLGTPVVYFTPPYPTLGTGNPLLSTQQANLPYDYIKSVNPEVMFTGRQHVDFVNEPSDDAAVSYDVTNLVGGVVNTRWIMISVYSQYLFPPDPLPANPPGNTYGGDFSDVADNYNNYMLLRVRPALHIRV